MKAISNASVPACTINIWRIFTLGCTPKPPKFYIKLHQMMPCIHINHKKVVFHLPIRILPNISPQVTFSLGASLKRCFHSNCINWAFLLVPVADLGWSIGEGHFRSKGRGRQNSLQRAWPAENFPECPYIAEDSYYIASNNCGA